MGIHAPSFSLTFIVLVLPGVIALIAENAGHVKAVAEITGTNLDPMMGRALAADGFATAIATGVGGSPTTTYARTSASWRPPRCTPPRRTPRPG